MVAQQLIPKLGGGRVAAVEILAVIRKSETERWLAEAGERE